MLSRAIPAKQPTSRGPRRLGEFMPPSPPPPPAAAADEEEDDEEAAAGGAGTPPSTAVSMWFMARMAPVLVPLPLPLPPVPTPVLPWLGFSGSGAVVNSW